MLPPCFPPASTVRRWFYLWRDNGLWKTINHHLLMTLREAMGREDQSSPNHRVAFRASITATITPASAPRAIFTATPSISSSTALT
jgi:transposase